MTRVRLTGLGVVMALAFGAGCKGKAPGDSQPAKAWDGTIELVARAGKDGQSGFEVCAEAGCRSAAVGEAAPSGSRMKTDGRTRAKVRLSDKSAIVIDRDSELLLVGTSPRTARLTQGAAAVEAAASDTVAKLEMPGGRVETSDAQFEAIADGTTAHVTVARGAVRIHAANEASGSAGMSVLAGEEARIAADGSIALSTGLAESELADVSVAIDPKEPLRGVGELRAKIPGESDEKQRRLRVTKHAITTRIADAFARTEIEEVFTNDSGDELEGVYRFPLPPDAKIEALALEVDGKLVQGAFVERDKAKRIFKGAVQNAVAPLLPMNALGGISTSEILWRTGNWNDPALLEWQRGGRFELKIFPIGAKSSRRVVLAYTQTLPPGPGTRRYTYELAYDPTASTTIGAFSADVQVIGHARDAGMRARGYAFQTADASDAAAERVTFAAPSFVPAGDFTVDFTLPSDAREVTAYGYELASTKGKQPDAGAFASLQTDSPYVAIALRPKLPRWTDAARRDYAIVVDASRSMAGERFARASKLAVALVAELDPRDRFAILACDETCLPMHTALAAPSPAAADDVTKFLGGVEPEGGTDVLAAVRAAQKIAGTSEGRELRVVYVGDGTATVGPTRGSHVETAIEKTLPPRASVTAVSIGSDCDVAALASIARGGGGTVVPFVPGQSATTAARAVVAATYGVALRAPTIVLPDGLTQMVPAQLDDIPVGGEAIVVVRARDRNVDGDITLKGSVGADAFEQKYPLHLTATFAAANAFVPRLAAAARIAELERAGGDSGKTEMIALSKQFAVASPYTSLLVLESEAMFQAFGIDRSQLAPAWTGDLQAQSSTSSGEEALQGDANQAQLSLLGALSAPAAAAPAMDVLNGSAGGVGVAGGGGLGSIRGTGSLSDIGGGGHYVTKWTRSATIGADASSLVAQAQAQIGAAEDAVQKNPDSKTKLALLYRLYARAEQIDRATDLVKRWVARDALDPDATRARADLAARTGDRARALRILGGVVDATPDDVVTHTRLAKTFDAQGETDRACAHRVAIADAKPTAQSVTNAIRCLRQAGMTALADALRADVPDATRDAVDKALAAPAPAVTVGLSGDVQLDATWDADADLDLALIDSQGRRVSWLGAGSTSFTVTTPTGLHSEAVGYLGLGGGSYAIEIAHATPGDATKPVHGNLVVRAIGQTQKIPFTLSSVRAETGRVDVKVESHDELVGDPNVIRGPQGNVMIGAPTSTVPISNLDRVAAMQRAGMRACYNQGLAQDPSMSGKLVLQAKISPSGEIDAVNAVSNAGLSGSVVSCATNRLRRAQFDPPGGSGGTALFPFTFVRQN